MAKVTDVSATANTELGMFKSVGGTIVKGFTLYDTAVLIGSFPSHPNCPLETVRSHIANAANSIAQPIHSFSALTVCEVQEDVHRIINSGYLSSCMLVAIDTHDGIRLEFQAFGKSCSSILLSRLKWESITMIRYLYRTFSTRDVSPGGTKIPRIQNQPTRSHSIGAHVMRQAALASGQSLHIAMENPQIRTW
ncbi:hypothetical protein VNO77_15252 [Canavalia gladiata]|uniref:Uncharacterized protein n=1 Tax=Canavalia gladiata TaxID=3824 RepID=A0AAN9LZD0_CANGL